MAVTEQTPIQTYTANGSTTVFAFPFLALLAGDLVVTVSTTDTEPDVMTLGVDYTVAGLGVSSGGTVTFVVAPANGAEVIIYRDTSLTRSTDYQDNGDLLAAVVNEDFDRLWLAMQERGLNDTRSLRLPIGEGPADLPALSVRANKALGFNSLGLPEMIAPEAHVLDTQAPETGGVVEQVTVWIQRERVRPEQFGCTPGTGAADQATNLQKAINAASSRGMPLNLGGKVWKASAGLVIPLAGIEIEKGQLYMPTVASGGYGVTSAGGLGTGLVVAASVSRGADVLTVPTASLVVGKWYKLASDDLWADSGSGVTVTCGEWVRVRAILGANSVRLYRPTFDAYSTNPRLYPVSWVDHAYLTDVEALGGGAGLNQNGLSLAYCLDVRAYNSAARSIAARGLAYDHCLDIEIDGGMPGDGDDSTGLAYGHIITGPTIRARSRSVRGDSLRHVVTAGGSSGVVRGYRCDGIVGTAMTDATVDAHPAVDDAVFCDIRHDGDTYTNGVTPMGADGDGIVSQALVTHVDGYVIRRPGRHGILIQPACKLYKGRAKVGQGEIRDHGSYSSASGWAINFAVDYNASLGLTLATVDGADIESAEGYANGIQIAATTGGVAHGTISARVTTQGRAVLARGDGQTIANLQVQGGYYERTTTTAEVVMLWGTSSGQVTQSKVGGAYVKGGTYGVRGLNATSNNVANNTIKNYATGAITGITHDGTTEFVVNNET